MVRKYTLCAFSSFNFIKSCLMAQHIVLCRRFCVYLRRMYSAVVGKRVLQTFAWSSWFLVLFKTSISLLYFCLILSILESEVLMSPIFIVESSLSFNYVSFCSLYFGAFVVSAYMFVTVICFSQIGPIIFYKIALYLQQQFASWVKIHFDICIATSAFLWLLFV